MWFEDANPVGPFKTPAGITAFDFDLGGAIYRIHAPPEEGAEELLAALDALLHAVNSVVYYRGCARQISLTPASFTLDGRFYNVIRVGIMRGRDGTPDYFHGFPEPPEECTGLMI